MTVPSDSTVATYTLNVYNDSSPYIEFAVTVQGGLSVGGVTADDVDGYLRAGAQAVVDAFHADYPGLSKNATVVYTRETAGTSVIPT